MEYFKPSLLLWITPMIFYTKVTIMNLSLVCSIWDFIFLSWALVDLGFIISLIIR
jgi:hypothetical protein